MAAGRNENAEPIPYTSVGLSRSTLDRVDRLRICMGRSRSHVMEQALLYAGGLAGLEAAFSANLRMVRELARLRGQSWEQLVESYVKEYGGKTYPPTVEQLMTRGERESLGAAPMPA